MTLRPVARTTTTGTCNRKKTSHEEHFKRRRPKHVVQQLSREDIQELLILRWHGLTPEQWNALPALVKVDHRGSLLPGVGAGVMTAAELDAIRDEAATRTARYELLTNQAETTGTVFAYNQPLPPLPNHRTHREWETNKETT